MDGVACRTKNKWHPRRHSELCRHVSTALLQFFNAKEAAVERCEWSSDIKQKRVWGECVSAHTKLLQTKPVEIDGFETRLACFPLIIPSHRHLSLSLLIPWLCFEGSIVRQQLTASDLIQEETRQVEEYMQAWRLNGAVGAGRGLYVLALTGAAGSPWQSDLKLPRCSAWLASEVTGESQCTLRLPLRPACSAWQTTGADGAKCIARNKVNQSKVTWLHSKTSVLQTHRTPCLYVQPYLFGVKYCSWEHEHFMKWKTGRWMEEVWERSKTQMVFYKCWLLLMPNCTSQMSFKLLLK